MPSSPPLRWADLVGVRVGIWGLGEEGQASKRRLEAMGVRPVTVDNDRGIDALQHCEVVIKSPGVSRHRAEVVALEDAGIPVVGGLGLWMEGVDRDRVICITGTKGKSTTVSIIGHLLNGFGRTCFVGGNLGQPPFDLNAPTDVDAWVIEASSFQVTDLWSSPPVVGVTSLHPDHLDWHGSWERYVADKLGVCTLPGARDVVVNGDDAMLRGHRDLLGPAPIWVTPDQEPWVEALGLRGGHNQVNALIARRCLECFGVGDARDDGALAGAAAGFRSLPSRLESIGVVGGVEFVDDSLSTNVLPTVAALSVFPDRRVALLVGGYDRQIDYTPLAHHLSFREAPLLVLALPDSGARIKEVIEAAAQPPSVSVVLCADLADAVGRGFEWAQPDGVVLLSPAAPSFGQFANYAARSQAFREAMAGCVPGA